MVDVGLYCWVAIIAEGVESKRPLDSDLTSLIYTESISVILDLRLVYPTAKRLIARGSQTTFAMPSQLGSLGDAPGPLNPTNLIRAPCQLLLASNLAALTVSGNLHDGSRDPFGSRCRLTPAGLAGAGLAPAALPDMPE